MFQVPGPKSSLFHQGTSSGEEESERFVISNQLLQPGNCHTAGGAGALYSESALIILMVMTIILTLALFGCIANLFW